MSSPANPLHHPGAGAPPSTFEEATYRKVAWPLTPLLMLSDGATASYTGGSGSAAESLATAVVVGRCTRDGLATATE